MNTIANLRDRFALRLGAVGMRARTLLPLIAAFVVAACHSLGPQTVARDRSDYSNAIAESWKRQTLLNVVKLRYLDPPIFVDVGQIISAYSLESTVDLGAVFARTPDDTNTNLGVRGTFTDRPTVTYVPLTGDRFISGLMMPLPPESLLLAIQSGWAADMILSLGVSVINGIHNGAPALNAAQAADPRFARVAELMRDIQRTGSVNFVVDRGVGGKPSTVMTFRNRGIMPETLGQIRELRNLLGLDQESMNFELVEGEVAANDTQIAIRSWSLLYAITTLSTRVAVPERDVTDGRALPGASTSQLGSGFRVLSADQQPKDAFAAVRYRDHWFYVEDRDLASKRMFGFLMLLFTLADTGNAKPGGPVLTIPAQ